jgi:hypothetical protein
MQERDARCAERILIVAIFCAEIDDRRYAMRPSQLGGVIRREAGADGEMLGEPVEIGSPVRSHIGIFFFKINNIFFPTHVPTVVFTVVLADLLLFRRHIMEQQSFTTVPPTI